MSLVIHAGELIPKDRARELMMAEFQPYGYTAATIERFLERAYWATQNYLGELNWVTKEVRQVSLDAALKRDAEMAAQWRAQPPGVREAHAKRCREEEEAAERWKQERDSARRQQIAEYEARQQAEREQLLKEAAERRRKAEWQQRFDQWQAANETGGRDAYAERRARQREREDKKAFQRILDKIEETEEEARFFWASRGGTFTSLLNLMTDHQYIEWMFDCFAHRYPALI